MPSRVLFFVETPHRLAGAQRALLAMLERISDHGVEPLVVLPSEGRVLDAFVDAGLDVRVERAPASLLVFERGLLRLAAREKLSVALRDVLPYSVRLARLARREGVRIVHFNSLRGLLLAGLAAKPLGLDVVLHLHGMPNFGSRAALVAGTTYADRLVLCADAIRSGLGPLARAKSTTVHNGLVRVPSFDRAAARAALLDALGVHDRARDAARVVVTLSTRTAFKGLHHLVDAFARLRLRDANLSWAMIGPEGEASYVRFLDERIAQSGAPPGSVVTLGYRSDAWALLAGADLLVLPTVDRETLDDGTGERTVELTEGLPMVVLEALAVGVPVVATDVAGVREQLEDGVTGRIVPPRDVPALERAIRETLGDDGMRAHVRAHGPAIVRARFTADRAARDLARVLLGVRDARDQAAWKLAR